MLEEEKRKSRMRSWKRSRGDVKKETEEKDKEELSNYRSFTIARGLKVKPLYLPLYAQ